MKTRRVVPLCVGGLIAGLAVLATTALARAEEPFPGGLQEAAGLACAPSCAVCHTTNPGQVGTWTKPLGTAVFRRGAMKGTGEAGIKAAYAKLVADSKGTDLNAIEAAGLVAKLQAGVDPQSGEELCQLTYGCGAHIAKDAPRDAWSGLLFAAGAMGFGTLLRRTMRR